MDKTFYRVQTFTQIIWEAAWRKKQAVERRASSTSYRAFFEGEDLGIFIVAGCVDSVSVNKLTEIQTKLYVENKSKKEATREKLYLIGRAVKPAAILMHILEAEHRLWTLYRAYTQTLRAATYAEIIEISPHIAINHFLKRSGPLQIKHRCMDMITLRKNESFHEENFNRFVRKVAVQARKIQNELRSIPSA